MLKAERIEVETSWKSTYATSFAINKQRKMGLKGPASLIGSWNLPISLERIKPFMIPIDHGGERHRKSNSLSFRQSFKPNEGSNLGAAQKTINYSVPANVWETRTTIITTKAMQQ
jgi:hypothetical protein